MSDNSRGRGLSVVGPFILIGLGIVLLLQQLNMIQWSLWEIAFRMWPLIIVAVGADILIARRSFLGAAASLVVLLALLMGGIYLMGAGPVRSGERLSAEEISYLLDDAKSGQFDLSLDAGAMQIRALPETSANAIEGTVHQANNEEVTIDHHVSGGVVSVSIQTKFPQNYIFNQYVDITWDLKLSPRIPLVVDLSMGAGEIDADLTGLKITSVDVKMGAGKVILRLPANSSIDVSVKVGAGEALVYLPHGSAMDVSCTTAVGNCDLPNGSGLWSQNYTSPNYASSDYKVHIDANVAVGSAKILGE